MKKTSLFPAFVLLACAVLPLSAAHAGTPREPVKNTNISNDPGVIAAQTKRNEAQRALAEAKARLPASKEENKAAVVAAQKALDETSAALKAARTAAQKAKDDAIKAQQRQRRR